jgi:hypothetical protein
MIGYFQSESYFSSDAKRYLADLTPIFQSEELSEYRELALRESPIVIHVRLGDYEQEAHFGIPTFKYYSIASRELVGLHPEAKIWIFSNDIEKAKKFLDSFIPKDVRWINEIDNSPIQTLEVMRLGKAYVTANSTYSWWGAYISNTPDPITIAPSPWFQKIKEPNSIVPVRWNRENGW